MGSGFAIGPPVAISYQNPNGRSYENVRKRTKATKPVEHEVPLNTTDDPIDNTPSAVVESGFTISQPPEKEDTMSFDTPEGHTETLNPLPVREPSKQELKAAAAQAKIAAKAAKKEAAELAKAEKAAAKLAAIQSKNQSTKEERDAAKAERAARIAALDPDGKRKYVGSMLALADRVKLGLYVKGVTGQLRSNDELAQILDGVTPNGVIQTAKTVLALDVNPYSHLNVGQQSMNLRNKLRGALRKGTISLHTIRTYVADNELDVSQSIVEKAAAKAARVATAKAEREAKAAAKLAASEAVEA